MDLIIKIKNKYNSWKIAFWNWMIALHMKLLGTFEARKVSKGRKTCKNCIMTVVMYLFTAYPALAAANAGEILGGVLGIVLAMFNFVGIALVVWGIAQFVLAVKRTDAESKSDAVQTIVCGIALMALKTLLGSLNLGVTIKDVSL